MRSGDTIVALSSGATPSGVAIVRVSGPGAGGVVTEIVGRLPEARKLHLASITLDGEALDQGLVAWMPGPHSFSGEDCAELQVHGSPAVVKALLRRLRQRDGFRLAEAGEFTRRAFENGKLDLTEVQGLGDLIVAETESQRQLGLARLRGGLTGKIESWRERLLDLRAEIEAQLDFSDEDDVRPLGRSYLQALDALRRDVEAVLASRAQGRILREGFRVVLAGPPNVGKSSLLNALSQSDEAIVSDEPGTTRDLKEIHLDLEGQLVTLIDSAGLRDTTSKAEAIGVARAQAAIAGADLVLWLSSPDQPETALLPAPRDPASRTINVRRIAMKADLGVVADCACAVSTRSGEGLADLLALIVDASGTRGIAAADILVSHEQDRVALEAALAAIEDAGQMLTREELAGEALRRASAALERLLGRMDAEQVLDRLFTSFCIGK